jgi:hypothetical protein
MDMLGHRPHASNVAVVSLLRNKNGGGTLIFLKNKTKKIWTDCNTFITSIARYTVVIESKKKMCIISIVTGKAMVHPGRRFIW